MVLGWIKRRIKKSSIDSMSDEIQRFIRSLEGADGEEVGMMLVVANVLRLNRERPSQIETRTQLAG